VTEIQTFFEDLGSRTRLCEEEPLPLYLEVAYVSCLYLTDDASDGDRIYLKEILGAELQQNIMQCVGTVVWQNLRCSEYVVFPLVTCLSRAQ
jgi:hypothetical protein